MVEWIAKEKKKTSKISAVKIFTRQICGRTGLVDRLIETEILALQTRRKLKPFQYYMQIVHEDKSMKVM
jgi:hypothetical protein